MLQECHATGSHGRPLLVSQPCQLRSWRSPPATRRCRRHRRDPRRLPLRRPSRHRTETPSLDSRPAAPRHRPSLDSRPAAPRHRPSLDSRPAAPPSPPEPGQPPGGTPSPPEPGQPPGGAPSPPEPGQPPGGTPSPPEPGQPPGDESPQQPLPEFVAPAIVTVTSSLTGTVAEGDKFTFTLRISHERSAIIFYAVHDTWYKGPGSLTVNHTTAYLEDLVSFISGCRGCPSVPPFEYEPVLSEDVTITVPECCSPESDWHSEYNRLNRITRRFTVEFAVAEYHSATAMISGRSTFSAGFRS